MGEGRGEDKNTAISSSYVPPSPLSHPTKGGEIQLFTKLSLNDMSKNIKQLNIKNGSTRINFIPSFAGNPSFQRWAIVISMTLILTLILSQQIHLASPEYKLGSIATKDIKADRDLLVEDRASTEQKRLQAVGMAKPIYDYDGNMPAKIGTTMAKAFLGMAEAYNHINGQNISLKDKKIAVKKARKDFENTLGFKLANNEYETFQKYKFSLDICNHIVRLIYSVYNGRLIAREDLSHLNKDKGITIRNIQTQSEEEKNDLSSILNMGKVNALILRNSAVILAKEANDIRQVSCSLAGKAIQPNLTFAKNTTEKRKQSIMDTVKPVFYKVQKNEMIVREGEKISATHLDKLYALYKNRGGKDFLNISMFLGMFLTIMLFSIILYHIFKPCLKSANINTDILLLGIASIFHVLAVRAGMFICESTNHAFPVIPVSACFYAIPFAAATILVVVLLNRNVGMIFALFSAFLISFLFEEKASMFVFSLLGSMVAAYKITECKERSAFIKTGIYVGLINMAAIICLSLFSGKLFTTDTLFNLLMGTIGGILSAVIASSIIPLFESFFGYTTDIKLLELANLNQPVFQKMIMLAPGTYHHSIVVASMVEAAAEAINANSLLAKVSAYYHDIGKMKKSLYFIENQNGMINKLDKLSPKMSSLVIISHVKEGCELAKKYKLGREITDIIRQHHGTRTVGYFYEKAQQGKNPSARSISEDEFRYPGPKPKTKEAGLVLLGDVIEASSRVLKDPTPSRIKSLVADRINQVLMEGELNESDLTFHDLSRIADSFTRILNGIFHQRINYPEPIAKENNGKNTRNGNLSRKPPGKNKNKYPKVAQNP